MPNTPALVQTGAHGLFANAEVGSNDRELASQVLASTGLTIWVNSEAQIDAVTAVFWFRTRLFLLYDGKHDPCR